MSALTNLALDHIKAKYSISETRGRFTEDSEHWLFEVKRVRLPGCAETSARFPTQKKFGRTTTQGETDDPLSSSLTSGRS